MKRLLILSLLALAAPAAFAADVGVSISIGEPGFYGRLDIGGFPQPPVIYAQPIVVQPLPGRPSAPIYLRVPPGYARHWRAHCREYNACSVLVYFVREKWYSGVYAPRYREMHGPPGA
jgi:hypothetical protein